MGSHAVRVAVSKAFFCRHWIHLVSVEMPKNSAQEEIVSSLVHAVADRQMSVPSVKASLLYTARERAHQSLRMTYFIVVCLCACFQEK